MPTSNSNPPEIIEQPEEWRDIPGFEGVYQISNYGIVASLARYDSMGRWRKERILSMTYNALGYLRVALTQDGGDKRYFVHALVLLAFVGVRPAGMDINHMDGNKLNNYVGNLEYCTTSQNIQHSYDTGLQKPTIGEANGRAKLTNDDVRLIRGMLSEGKSQPTIASMFGVTPSTISQIKTGCRWGHIR